MSRETLVILNPASAAGATGRSVQALSAAIEAACGPFTLCETGSPGDATELARRAADDGVGRILVAGGDGTTSEVVAGLLSSEAADASERPVVGLLPLGSGWDLARTLGLPRTLDAALGVIAAGATRTIDAGRVETVDGSGASQSRYFVNEASVGLSGTTVRIVGEWSKRIGPRLGFVAGAVAAIFTHKSVDLAVEVDGMRIYEGPISMVVAANGQYFGAGMHVAPGARLDDGRLEIILVRGMRVPRLLVNLPSFYFGRHVNHDRVSCHSGRTLALIPKQGHAPVDLDGEAVGGLPLRAEILPAAIRVAAPVPVLTPLPVRALATGAGRVSTDPAEAAS